MDVCRAQTWFKNDRAGRTNNVTISLNSRANGYDYIRLILLSKAIEIIVFLHRLLLRNGLLEKD